MRFIIVISALATCTALSGCKEEASKTTAASTGVNATAPALDLKTESACTLKPTLTGTLLTCGDSAVVIPAAVAINGQPGPAGPPGTNGVPGSNGSSSLVKMVDEAAGANCTSGGKKIMVGIDNGASGSVANNGILESGEVTQASYVCAVASSAPRLVIKSGNTTLAYLVSAVGGGDGYFALPSGHIFRLNLATGTIPTENVVYQGTGCVGTKYFTDAVHVSWTDQSFTHFLTLKRIVKNGTLYEVAAMNPVPLYWNSYQNAGCTNGSSDNAANHSGILSVFTGTMPDFTALAPISLVLE